MKWKGDSSKFGFYLAKGEMKEENLEALRINMAILIAELDVFHVLEWKGNLTDSTVWNTGETGDMYCCFADKS